MLTTLLGIRDRAVNKPIAILVELTFSEDILTFKQQTDIKCHGLSSVESHQR